MEREPIGSDEKLWDHHQVENVGYFEAGHARQDLLFREIKKRIREKERILEIGFGDGYLLRRLSRRYRCSGADISEKNVLQMKSQGNKSVDFKTVGVDGSLPYPDASFGAFVASEVLEHMEDGELIRCVAEIRRVLKKGGLAFLTFPAKENLKNNECFCPHCGTVFHKWGHKQSWDPNRIGEVFSQFERVALRDFFLPYRGSGLLERTLGGILWAIRSVLKSVLPLDGATYLLIVKNR